MFCIVWGMSLNFWLLFNAGLLFVSRFFVHVLSSKLCVFLIPWLLCMSLIVNASQFPISSAYLTVAKEHLSAQKSDILTRYKQHADLVASIKQEIAVNALPPSFIFLPMLESSFNANAVSTAQAAGLWQLMPETATRFGLIVSSNEDQRFDSKKSTIAAIKYLKFLYQKFGQDSLMTVAAYNAGEGRVSRAFDAHNSNKKNGLRLPKETQNYVHRYIALTQLISLEDISALSIPHSLSFSPFSSSDFFNFNSRQAVIDLEKKTPLVVF